MKKKKKKDEKFKLGVKDDILPEVDEGKVYEKKKWRKLGFWNKRKLKKKPETSFLIRMFFSNGTSREFVIVTRNEVFRYKKRTYYLRYEDSWFNLTQNQYELNYFDDFAVPLDRKVIKLGNKKYWSVTPENVKPIIDMNYVKVLAEAGEMDKWVKMVLIVVILLFFFTLYVMLKVVKIGKQVGL